MKYREHRPGPCPALGRFVVVASAIFLTMLGCAVMPISRPSPLADPIELRQSLDELDAAFGAQNNDTGEWTRTLVHQAVIDNGERLVYEYRWVMNGIKFADPSIVQYRVVFEHGHVVSYDVITPERETAASNQKKTSSKSKSGMDILCKDAIARQDQGGIFVHCE